MFTEEVEDLSNLNPSDRPLTPLEQAFIREYLLDPSSSAKAAIRAGYSIDTAPQAASRLIKSPKIKKAIEEAKEEAVEALGLTQARVLQELWKIAGANPGDVVEVGEDLEPELKASRASEVVISTTSGKTKTKVVTVKTVKPADKVAALVTVAKIMNLFPKEQLEVKGQLSLTELIEASIGPTIIPQRESFLIENKTQEVG